MPPPAAAPRMSAVKPLVLPMYLQSNAVLLSLSLLHGLSTGESRKL